MCGHFSYIGLEAFRQDGLAEGAQPIKARPERASGGHVPRTGSKWYPVWVCFQSLEATLNEAFTHSASACSRRELHVVGLACSAAAGRVSLIHTSSTDADLA